MTAEQYLENEKDYNKIKESYPKLHNAIKEVMEGFAKQKCEELLSLVAKEDLDEFIRK